MAIKQLKNGKYRVDFRDCNGRRIRKTVEGGRKVAQECERKLRIDRQMGFLFPEKLSVNVTFGSLCESYFTLHGGQLRSDVWRSLSKRLLYVFGNTPMKQLTSIKLQQFYNHILETRTPATAKRYMTLVNAIINMAIKHNIYCGQNPCIALDMRPEDNKRTRYLEQAEINTLLKECRPDVRNVVLCALYTGMRRGEILELEWQRVDLHNDNITLLKTKSSKKREIPILPELKQILLRLGPKTEGNVFGVSRDAFICSFKRTLRRLNIPDFRFHDLRHTFASYFMMRGGVITDLQHILGHSDLKLTQRYAHLSPAHLKKGIQVMNGAFDLLNIGDTQ